MSKKVRLAVVGGRRGKNFKHALEALKGRIELAAVCDLNPEVLQLWGREHPGVKTYANYDELLDDSNIDAVLLATPMFVHAKQTVQALRAGKHVLSEVIASHTIEDSWELIEAVEESGLVYMMAENYCYMRPNMMIKHMVEHDLFGELTYAECGYVHDVRHLMHHEDGALTWRGKLTQQYRASVYPTHSIGPVAQWLKIGQAGGDEFAALTAFGSKGRAVAAYFKEHFGVDHPGASDAHWQTPDSTTTVIRTKNGVLIVLRVDIQSPRPHNTTHYELQGTKGAYLSPRHAGEDPLIWLDGISSGRSPLDDQGNAAEWESLWKHADQWEHPAWKQLDETVRKAGHGGGDYFVLADFADSILEGKPPAIDVYDAVTWSSIFPLSMESLAQGSKTVEFIPFQVKRKPSF